MHGRSHQRRVRSTLADAVVERLRAKVTALALHVFDALLPGKVGAAEIGGDSDANARNQSAVTARRRLTMVAVGASLFSV